MQWQEHQKQYCCCGTAIISSCSADSLCQKIDGTYYVVEAACENSYGKLWVQSAYLTKNGGLTQVSAEGQTADHKTYAQSELASPSPNPIIDQGCGAVNTNYQNRGMENGSAETVCSIGDIRRTPHSRGPSGKSGAQKM